MKYFFSCTSLRNACTNNQLDIRQHLFLTDSIFKSTNLPTKYVIPYIEEEGLDTIRRFVGVESEEEEEEEAFV